MQTDEDPELPIEVDAEGYRVDHRSETEQSSQSKEVHEYPDRTEIRLRDEKEVRLEEVKTRETKRQATYDEIIALLDAQMDGLDEVQTSREVTVQDLNRVERTRETVTGGELKREIRITDEKRKEEILEGPSDSKREVTKETETTVVGMQPSPGALSLEETESPLSQFSDDTEASSGQPSSRVTDPGLGAQPARGGINVGITPGAAEFRIRSEGVGGKTPGKTEREVVWIPKQTAAEEKGHLSVPGELNLAGSTGSLHRIQHRAHRLEELIVEDVDTFYEDQSKPAKRLSGLLGVKKEKRGKSQSPPATPERPASVTFGEKRPKLEDTKEPAVNEDKLVIETERPKQPAGVGITAVPRTDIGIKPNVPDSELAELADKPRDVIIDPQDGNTNRITYVVRYDYPAGVNIRDPGKRKKDVHPKKKKDKRRLGKQQPETEHEMPAETEFVTYVVNYDRTEPLDGDNMPPRPTVSTKPESSFPEPSIPKDPRAAENVTIEVDMNAGDVKVMEPVKVTEELHGGSKTFVVDYKIPEKPAKPSKPRKEFQEEVTIPETGKRQSPNEDITYIVNYDLPSVTPVVPPTLEKTPVGSADVDLDLEKKAPVYSITVVEPGPGVSAEGTKQSQEKTGKERERDNKEAFEMTYIVNYDEPQEAGKTPRKEGGGDIWVRPTKPAFETAVKGKGEMKETPAKLKDAPENIESMTYVVEYEGGAEEKEAKGGIPVPKLKKDSSSNDGVEKRYTYIVNYDQPLGRQKKEKKKKEGKKGKNVKATVKPEEPHLKKSFEVEQPSPELSIMVKHPFPEPIKEPEKPNPELSITVQQPIPEPTFEVREPSQEFSVTVDHPLPEPVAQPEEQFEEYSVTVDNLFPEPVAQPEEQFEEYSVTVDHPFPEPVVQPEEQFEEYSVTVDHPFPEPIARPQAPSEEFSITVDHPIPEAHLEIEEPVLPQPKLPEPVPSKDSGETLTYVVTYDQPAVSGKDKPSKTKKKRKSWFYKGSKPSVKAEVTTEPSKDIGQRFTYIVNYDEPSIRPKPIETERELFGKADVETPKLEIETSAKTSEPKETVGQSEALSIAVTQPIPEISRAKPDGTDIAISESAEVITYIVHHEEPSSVGLTGGKQKKKPKKEAELKTKKPTEIEFEMGVLPEESVEPLPTAEKPSSDLKIVVEHPVLEAPELTGYISAEAIPTLKTLKYVVSSDQPTSETEKVREAKGWNWDFGRQKPRAAVEIEAPKPTVTTPEVPAPTSLNESISFTVVRDQPELPEATSAISTDISVKPESYKQMTYIVNYDLPSKTGQDVEVPEIEAEPPATVEIPPPTANVSVELRDVQPPSTPSVKAEEPQTDISVKMEKPVIPVPASLILTPAGESITYIVHHEEPRAKATGKKKPEKEKAKKEGRTFPKKTPPAGAGIEVEGGPVSTSAYEVSVTTDQPKPAVSVEVPKKKPEVSVEATTPTITVPKIDKNVTTETVTFIVNYDQHGNVIPVPEVKDTAAIEVGVDEVPQIEPYEIPEPHVEVEEPSSKLSITVEEPSPKVSAEVELPTPDISMKVKEPVAPIVATPDIALPKGATAETITYIVNYEEPISGEVKPDDKEKKKRKKVPKDIKAGASIEAKAPEVTTEIAGGVPAYDVTVTTEQLGPSVDIKKKPEVSLTAPEAASSITKPSTDIDVQAQTQPQSITYIVNYDEPKKVIPKSKVKDITTTKETKIDVPKVKPPKAQEGELPLLREGESITYVVTYDDSGKVVPPPKIKESAALEFEVKDIPKIPSPEVPQTEVDTAEPSSQLTITVEQPLPEISAEVKPPTPEIKVKEPSELEQLTITVEQPPPEVSAEVKHPIPEITVKKPPKVDIALPSVEVSQGGTPESITYIVTHDESTLKRSGEAKPEKKEKKKRGFSFPGKKMSKEAEVEAKGPKAAIETESGTPIYEVSVTTEQPKPAVHIEGKKPEVSIETAKPVIEAPREKTALTSESMTYVVTYDDSGKVSPPEIKEPAAFEVQVQDIPHIKSPEIPEAEVKISEPSSQLAITVEHPTPDISAEVKAPTPEIKGPPEVVVKLPSVELPKVDKTETITYIVTHEEPALKVSEGVRPAKKEKKKRGFVFPGKKVSKDLKAGVKVEAKGPQAAAEIAGGVPVYEVATEQQEPSVGVKQKKPDVAVTTPEVAISTAKPVADISAQAQAQTQSITYIVTYDDKGKVIPPPVKKEPVAVELETTDIPDITYPEFPEAQLEVEKPSSELSITVEQPLPEIGEEVKPRTPEIEIKEPSVTEPISQLMITVGQPLPEVSLEVKPPTPEIKIREPSEVEQLTITVEKPLPEVSTKVKVPTPEIKVKESPEVVVTPPSVKPSKEGTTETITYIVTHEEPTLKISGVAQPEPKEKKKKKFRFPGKYFGKNFKAGAKAELKEPKISKEIKGEVPLPEISVAKPVPQVHIEGKKPAIDIATGEAVTYVVTYDDSANVVPATEIKSPEIPEAEFRVEEPSSQLTITVDQPLPEISKEVKLPTPEIKIKEPPEEERLAITVEQTIPEVSTKVKPPTPEIKIKEPPEEERLAITVEQPIPEVSTKVKPPTPEIKVKEPSGTVVKPPSVELPKTGTAETITYIVTHEEPALKVSGEVKPEKKEKKQFGVRLPGKKVAKELKAGADIEAKGPTAEVTGKVPAHEVTVATEQPADVSATPTGDIVLKDAVETVTYVVEHEEEPLAKEAISAEGQKKQKDWIWRVKKPAKSIDISTTESQETEAVRLEPEARITAEIEEPKIGISAETEIPSQEISISTEKPKVTQEIPQLTGLPETHTYIVTYDEPYTTTSKRKRKLWPFSRKAPSGKIEAEHKTKEKKWTLFKKKEPKAVKPRVDVQLSEITTPKDLVAGETIRGDIELSLPAAPSIAVEQKETMAGDVSGTVVIPAAPEFSVTVPQEEPSAQQITAPRPELKITEAEELDLDVQAQKPTGVSELKYDVEATLPGRKEQAFAEKIISAKLKVADTEAERKEPEDKDRTVITGGRRDYENAEEETVVYIVNYEQPFGTLTKAKDGAREAPTLKPSAEKEVAVEAEKPAVTNIEKNVQVQLPQLEQCILVPIRDESSPEDSFYGTEAPVPAWPPVDEPHFEEDTRPDYLDRKFETKWPSAVDEKQLPPHLVVVAIDFGTTFSGYAFSFSRDSAGSIHVMRKWEGGDPGAVDHKTPTILLLTPSGQFHSFGFTARDFYHDLSPKEATRWLYFEKFKMALHFNADLNADTKLAAANGQCVPAIDVFTHALRFFRKHVLQEVSDQVSTEVLNEDIYWIITVPAIWTEEAKQFMRLAAYRAGIASSNYPDQLLISLEPEAASIYVRKQRLHQLVPEVPFQRRRSYRRSVTPEPTAVNQPIVTSDRKVLPTDSSQIVKTTTTVTVSWPVVTTIPQTDITVGHQVDTAGSRYMVVDCGGGTVDITVHEIQSRDGTLRELHRATGGPFGSVAVDQEFEKLLVEIFGADFIDVFKAKRPAGWVDLLMAFESRKRAANPYLTKPLNVSLPFSFIDYHKKYRNCPVEHAIRKYNNRDIRWSSQGMLRLMPEAMNKLFLPAIEKIKEAIGNVLNNSEVKGLRFLFLVGGFADSPMLQVAIRQEFGHLLRVMIPNDASISILKGAVCFGLDPTVITTRKSRMTYGVGVLNRFVHGQHPPSKLILKDGEEWCTDVFDALVYADQSVAIGDTVLRRYTLVPGDADDVSVSKIVNIYSSDRREVKFVTDRGVTRCGTLSLMDEDRKKPSASRQDPKDREVQVRMTFGHTEIKVTAFDLSTRKSVRATIDFLNK